MTQPWVVAYFLDCENNGLREWRNPDGGLGPEIVKCPNVGARTIVLNLSL